MTALRSVALDVYELSLRATWDLKTFLEDSFSRSRMLEDVTIRNYNMEVKGIIAQLARLKHLRKLALIGRNESEIFDDGHMEYLSHHLGALVELTLRREVHDYPGCIQVSCEGLLHLVRGCRFLTALDIDLQLCDIREDHLYLPESTSAQRNLRRMHLTPVGLSSDLVDRFAQFVFDLLPSLEDVSLAPDNYHERWSPKYEEPVQLVEASQLLVGGS